MMQVGSSVLAPSFPLVDNQSQYSATFTADATTQLPSAIRLSGMVVVNEHNDDDQTQPKVIRLSDGRFLFAFSTQDSTDGDTSYSSVAARIGTLQADGSITFADEFRVNSYTDQFQSHPSITQLPDGRLLFVFGANSNGVGDDSGDAVVGRIGSLNPDGSVILGDEFLVNEHTYHHQYFQEVKALSDGRILFTFETMNSIDGDASHGSIAARIGTPNPDGSMTFGDEVRVNQQTDGVQNEAEILELSDGRILLVFTTRAYKFSNFHQNTVAARIVSIDENGTPSFNDEFIVNEVPSGAPQVVQLADGRLLFSYISAPSIEEPVGHRARFASLQRRPRR